MKHIYLEAGRRHYQIKYGDYYDFTLAATKQEAIALFKTSLKGKSKEFWQKYVAAFEMRKRETWL